MENNEKLLKAQEVYAKVCAMLDSKNWKYDKEESKLKIRCTLHGDDIPVDFMMKVDPERYIVSYISWMPFHMPEDKRVEGAVAVTVAGYGLVDGSFDYDINDGEITFRLTASYRGGVELTEELFEYMVYVATSTVDRYNDKFLMLSKGNMTLQQFIESEKA
ncbi:MAG: hypothetical protein J6K61_06465 [Clostridia bacterium]|nr:hypothetical protein [Clostridia bacterium]